MGERLVTPLKTKDFGRIAAQTAKHVIRQGLREGERSQQLQRDPVPCTRYHHRPPLPLWMQRGASCSDLGKGGEAILPQNEQVPGEHFTEGQTLQVYVVDVVRH